MTNTHQVLAIGGNEATGGAGVAADLRTLQAHSVFGSATLTCIVSFDPNDNWNHRFVAVEPPVIADQLEVTLATFRVPVVKIGMLGTPQTITTVKESLAEHEFTHFVVDPVLICKGQEPGQALDTDTALREHIIPRATFLTPNVFEVETLTGTHVASESDLVQAAQTLHEQTGAAVLAKGGMRLPGTEAVDVFTDGNVTEVLRAKKIGTKAVNGAGCTLASAVAANLALGYTPLEAAIRAKAFVTRGIERALEGATPFVALAQPLA